MYFTNYFLQVILLLGTVQGFILSGMLFSSAKINYTNWFLGMVVILVTLACLNGYFFHAIWFQSNILCQKLHAIVPLVIIMPVGPLIFYYTRSILEPTWRLKEKDRWHFLPVVIDLIPYVSAIIYIITYSIKAIPENSISVGLFIDTYNTYVDIPRWLSLSFYLFNSFKLLKSQNTNMIRERWLKLLIAFLAAFQFIWLIFLIPHLIPSVNIALLNAVGWYPVFIPLVFFIYWMGIKGYLISKTESGIPTKAVKAFIDLAPERSASVSALLIEAMETDKLFLRQDLNISLLSTHTGINSKTISAILNNCVKQSFSQWINNYRVSAFKDKIKAGESDHLTLAGIAAECGFSSQASFQRIFKQTTGVVPSKYRNTKGI